MLHRKLLARPLPLVLLGTLACGARTSLSHGTDPPVDAAVSPDAALPDAGATANDCDAFSPDEPLVLAEIDDRFATPVALRVVAPYVYVGVHVTAGEKNGTGTIYRVPLQGGVLEPVEEEHYNYGPIDHAGDALFFPQVAYGNSTSHHAAVMVRSLSEGTTYPLPNPVSPEGMVTISDLRVGPYGGLYWLAHPDAGGTALAHWDGEVVALTEIERFAYQLEVTDQVVFLKDNQTLYAASVTGGEATVVRTLGEDAALLGASGQVLVFTPDGTTIVRRGVAGEDTVLLKGATLRRRPYGNEVPSWVDERWVTYGEPERLARVPLDGGEAEVLAPQDGTIVEAISGDACNLYWLETRSQTPDALLARAVDP